MTTVDERPNPLTALTGKFAAVFPGQGSQFAGMGRALFDSSPAARQIFDQADALLDISLSTLCFDGPAEELEDTYNSQSAIFTVSIAALAAVKELVANAGGEFAPTVVAGHSLGEYTALVAAGAMDFAATLPLVRERGRLMKEAGAEHPGGMAAVIGLDDDVLAAVVEETRDDGVLVVANANCPGQTVISGALEPLARAIDLAKARGAKRVLRLPITIASHSPLMAHAAAQLRDLTAKISINPPQIPVVANATGQFLTTVAAIRQELAHHVERPVNWTKSVNEIIASGATTFIEIGPGQALAGLIKRIDRDAKTLRLEDLGLTAN